MLLNLKSKKIIIAGIHGSGKTELAKYISRGYKSVVYSPYPEEWSKEKVLFIKAKDFIAEFPYWCGEIIRLAEEKKINMAIFDDADLLFKTNFDVSPNTRRLIISHRHLGKGLSLVLITRRIQDIPAKIYGVCEFKALYSIDSPQAIDLLNKMDDGLGDKVKSLKYQSYNFWLKEIGHEPILSRVALKSPKKPSKE